jgi:hypothetical protein
MTVNLTPFDSSPRDASIELKKKITLFFFLVFKKIATFLRAMILASMESFCRILSRRPLIQDGGDRKFSNFRLIRVRHYHVHY